MYQLRNNFLAHYANQMDIATIVQRHPDPILVVNGRNEIVYANTAGARLLCRLPANNGFLHDAFNQEMNFGYIVNITDITNQTATFEVSRLEIQWGDHPARLFCLHDITTHSLYSSELEQLVYSDHLTGLYNSRGLEVLAAHVRSIAARTKQAITSFYIDVNQLKQVNDRFGHSMGDSAIIETAQVINHCFRNADVSARVGGDEFVVLTLDDADESVDALLERLRQEVDKRNACPDRCYQLSISVGVSRHAAGHEFNIQQLIREADRRMYVAKKQIHKGNVRHCNFYWPLADNPQYDTLLAAV